MERTGFFQERKESVQGVDQQMQKRRAPWPRASTRLRLWPRPPRQVFLRTDAWQTDRPKLEAGGRWLQCRHQNSVNVQNFSTRIERKVVRAYLEVRNVGEAMGRCVVSRATIDNLGGEGDVPSDQAFDAAVVAACSWCTSVNYNDQSTRLFPRSSCREWVHAARTAPSTVAAGTLDG